MRPGMTVSPRRSTVTGPAFGSTFTIFPRSTTMRVSWTTFPRPSRSVETAMTVGLSWARAERLIKRKSSRRFIGLVLHRGAYYAGMSVPGTDYMTAAEYLEIERKAETKSEYIGGRMYAMSGVSRRHSLISGNLHAEIHAQLRGRNCEAHIADMRLKVSPTGMYTYPDVVAVCGEARFEEI